ncbi:helix-turn-helix domain-containing protein [Caldifermentibacillus hisashii]|uniref:helix-turn-helix domain-containing protein n=1 Tax=Caldifermentibacillus hisashii TaxID=996558 RepID=UPI000BA48C95|nr:helix-turn-helix domain-containing protein [Caldifermentibacillus hisashii]PAC38135.1 helix-turn-helix domain-containing protein [Caldifermentibacillus hisashii]
MTELGNRLKEAREAKGLTLDDLQDITKIQKRYLKGIEEGNYDSIPGKFYVRAFIKQYGEAVGLDPESLFDEYKHEIPSVYEEQIAEPLSRSGTRKPDEGVSKFLEMLPRIIITLVIIGIIVLAWFFIQKAVSNNDAKTAVNDKQNNEAIEYAESGTPPKNEKNGKKRMKNQPRKRTVQKNDKKAGEKKNLKKTQNIAVVATQGNKTTYKLTNADKFQLTLKVINGGKSWVGIENANNQQLLNATITEAAPQTLDLTNETEIRIKTGYAPALEIYVNDQKLDIPTTANVQNIIIQYEKTGE